MQQSPSCKTNWYQPVKKFTEFCGARSFITANTSAHRLSLSLASFIQSITLNSTFWRSILLLSSHLRLDHPIGLFPSRFDTKTLYTPLISPIRATGPTHPRTTLFAIMIMLQIGRSLRPVRVTLWHECKANTVQTAAECCRNTFLENLHYVPQCWQQTVSMFHRQTDNCKSACAIFLSQ